MSLSVKESRFVAVNRVGENTLQTVLQGRVELPSTAAPVERIVWVKGTPKKLSFVVDQDRIYLQGAIDLAMVYVPETLEDEVAGLKRVEWPSALPFDTHVEVIGAEPEMMAEVDLKILACEWDLSSGQYALDVDLILAVTARVEQSSECLVISDINVSQVANVTTDGVVVHPIPQALKLEVAKEITGLLEFSQEEAVPVASILEINTQTRLLETEIKTGSLAIKGVACLEVLYEREDLTVAVQKFPEIFPFELAFESPQIQEGMDLKPQLLCRSEGFVVNEGKNARMEMHLWGQLLLSHYQPRQVLIEIAAPANQIEIRKEFITLDSLVNKKEQEASVQGLIELNEASPPMRELLISKAVAHVTDYDVENDKLAIEGVLDVELFYLAHSEEDTKPLFKAIFPEIIAFQQTLAIQGLELGMQPRIQVDVLDVKPDLINRETVEVTFVLRFLVDVVEYLEIEAAVEAVWVEPAEANPPTLTYVFVQKGDTIWKLSRTYHTTEEAILSANPSLQNGSKGLKTGERLLIPRS